MVIPVDLPLVVLVLSFFSFLFYCVCSDVLESKATSVDQSLRSEMDLSVMEVFCTVQCQQPLASRRLAALEIWLM